MAVDGTASGAMLLTHGGKGSAGLVALSPTAVALAAALIVVQAIVSLRFQLGLHTQLLVAASRCVLQLSALGYILVPIFDRNEWWLVLLYCAFMVWVSAIEAVGRPAKTFSGMFLNTLVIVGGTAAVIMAYALIVVMQVHPWWDAQYLIPILGMVLGNTITGIAIGLGKVIAELSSCADRVERLLSLGATRWEATHAPIARAVRLAMTPLLNQMSVVGLVSIPGMMTGQILAGSDPSEAARYQMVIMFLLGAAATLAAVVSIYTAVMHLVDGCHRLRGDRLLPKHKKGIFNWTWYQLVWLWRLFVRYFCCCFVRRREHGGGHEYQCLDGGDNSGSNRAHAPAGDSGASGSGGGGIGGGATRPLRDPLEGAPKPDVEAPPPTAKSQV